uniref:Uncharacterized protein n=1 Tax=Haptolina brevifila TaxID=156173 RepID=A0A7S2HJ94_9EUKA|mmetsp:Transcript_55135/g.109496  ORF Transcript_55135/g.109496 Transcript_55135/m.109496 type:complete len:100 (+) Transcript_55135:165-464(+)
MYYMHRSHTVRTYKHLTTSSPPSASPGRCKLAPQRLHPPTDDGGRVSGLNSTCAQRGHAYPYVVNNITSSATAAAAQDPISMPCTLLRSTYTLHEITLR